MQQQKTRPACRPVSPAQGAGTDPFDEARRRRAVRVAVVDGAEVTRAGAASLLAHHLQVVEVVALSHEAAEARRSWSDVDVVVVDAVDGRCPSDQVRGVTVARRIRAHRSPAQTRIVVVSGIGSDDPVRLRMREAGADHYIHRSLLVGDGSLARAVLRVDGEMPGAQDPEALHRLGITRCSRINDGVDAAMVEELVPEAGWVGPRGRDRYARRVRFNERARLRPVCADGLAPDREQSVPSLLQIQRFVLWATRIDQRVGWPFGQPRSHDQPRTGLLTSATADRTTEERHP